jgi:hypothetical protein
MTDLISLEDCVDGAIYKIVARNFGIALFAKASNSFTGIRYKFGDRFLSEEYHYDAGGTVRPVATVEQYCEDTGFIEDAKGIDKRRELFKRLTELSDERFLHG